MTRMVDLVCPSCGRELKDRMTNEHAHIRCQCNAIMEQIWWRRSSSQRVTQWDERDSVVVFENPNPLDDRARFSFPARNDKPCPSGWVKHVARSDREVGQLERMTGTLNHSRWYDSNGRGFDDYYRGEKLTH